jgi:hypothetical protein
MKSSCSVKASSTACPNKWLSERYERSKFFELSDLYELARFLSQRIKPPTQGSFSYNSSAASQ